MYMPANICFLRIRANVEVGGAIAPPTSTWARIRLHWPRDTEAYHCWAVVLNPCYAEISKMSDPCADCQNTHRLNHVGYGVFMLVGDHMSCIKLFLTQKKIASFIFFLTKFGNLRKFRNRRFGHNRIFFVFCTITTRYAGKAWFSLRICTISRIAPFLNC